MLISGPKNGPIDEINGAPSSTVLYTGVICINSEWGRVRMMERGKLFATKIQLPLRTSLISPSEGRDSMSRGRLTVARREDVTVKGEEKRPVVGKFCVAVSSSTISCEAGSTSPSTPSISSNSSNVTNAAASASTLPADDEGPSDFVLLGASSMDACLGDTGLYGPNKSPMMTSKSSSSGLMGMGEAGERMSFSGGGDVASGRGDSAPSLVGVDEGDSSGGVDMEKVSVRWLPSRPMAAFADEEFVKWPLRCRCSPSSTGLVLEPVV